jgi:tetratricopeptide (TPR) repeat protein
MNNGHRPDSPNSLDTRPDRFPVLAAGVLLLVALGWLLIGPGSGQQSQPPAPREVGVASSATNSGASLPSQQSWRRSLGVGPSQTAEQVVAMKVADFGRKRLEWIRAKSVRTGQDVPREVEEFFKALEGGKWEEIDASFAGLAKRSAQYEGSTHWPELDPFWCAVLEAYGAAEQAHLWPADKLLEYGSEILGSLKPGMVYVGGTDPGRFVPTFLNETGEGDQHLILTQNALADSRYLEYLREKHADDFTLPSQADSSRIFDEYVADARQRLEHDQEFPNEPKQIRPGENVKVVDGKTEVQGNVAVMIINEKLLQWMIQGNPDASFALEESQPMRSTYKDAVPLGPIMQISSSETFDQQDATAAVEHWRNFARQLPPGTPSDNDAHIKAYEHMAAAQANLLASRNFSAEAEATYKLASEIYPRSVHAIMNYTQFLSESGRPDEAREILSAFQQRHPDLNDKIKTEMVLKR